MHDALTNLPELETTRLVLRRMNVRDAPAMYRYASDPEVTRYVRWDTHDSPETTRAYLESVEGKYREGEAADWGIVLKESGVFAGTCGFAAWNEPDRCAEIGWVLSKGFWGRGIAAEAAGAVFRFGFEAMDVHRIEAMCMLPNAASERVMRKLGMCFEGVLRERLYAKNSFHDVKLYSMLRHEFLRT